MKNRKKTKRIDCDRPSWIIPVTNYELASPQQKFVIIKAKKSFRRKFINFWINDWVYLYGISVRLDWLWECGTLGMVVTSLTPITASSWADPERLRSLPRRRPPPVAPIFPCCCCKLPGIGAALVDIFFFVWPPKTKNLLFFIEKINRFVRENRLERKNVTFPMEFFVKICRTRSKFLKN